MFHGDRIRVFILTWLAVAECQYTVYQTDGWHTYPGYSGAFNGAGVTGALEILAGETANDVVLRGSLSNLPDGQFNGLHVHEGFDVDEAATIGGHFYPGLSVDPWILVNYTGPADTVHATVNGVPWRKTLGRVVVIHDSSGARVAIAKIVPKAVSGSTLYSASLSTYPLYSSLVARIDNYPGTTQGVSGTVWVTEKAGGGFTLTYDLAGLVSGDTSGGIHIHAGFGETACDAHENVLGHFWTPTTATDPWNTTYAKLAGQTVAQGSVEVADTGYPLGAKEYQALVIHRQDGTRIGCGILHSVARASLSAYPSYNGLNPAVTGTVWVAQGTSAGEDLVLSYKINNLPEEETSGGLHIHQGKTCGSDDAIGGHFWTPSSAADPWNTVWTKENDTTTATGRFSLNSGYTLAENADHAIVVHDSSGTRIGCGQLQFYPMARGYVVLTGGLTLTGNLGGVMFQPGASGGIHVHAGTSCQDVAGASSPGGHLLNSDGSDPWSTTYTVGGRVGRPLGGQDYGASTCSSGEAPVDVSVTGDQQTLAVATGKTVVVHSMNGARIACGVIEAQQIQSTQPDVPEPTSSGQGILVSLGKVMLLAFLAFSME